MCGATDMTVTFTKNLFGKENGIDANDQENLYQEIEKQFGTKKSNSFTDRKCTEKRKNG